MFHHWTSDHVKSSLATPELSPNAIQMKLGHEELKLLHGLRDLGFFQFRATDASSSRIHDYLTTLMDSSALSDSEIISSILSRIRSAELSSSSQADFTSVKLLALIIHSNSAHGLFSGGVVPAWKWYIPGDPSWDMKKSAWKPDLETLLTYPD